MNSAMQNMRLNFLFVEQYNFSDRWMYPNDYVPYCMYRYIIDGKAVFKINDEEFVVHEDDVVYIPQGCRLECWALTAITFITIRFFNSFGVPNSDMLHEYYNLPNVTHSSNSRIKEHFQNVYRYAISRQRNKMFWVRAYLDMITAELTETACSGQNEDELYNAPINHVDPFQSPEFKKRIKNASSYNDNRITMLVDYLATHSSESLSVQQMSEMIEVSVSTLRRLFKIHTGKSPSNFVTEMKMVNAARHILVSNTRISDIAREFGFKTPNYFARQFNKIYGLPPREYRKQSREL